MFVLFFRLFDHFESFAFFENGGTNLTPKQSNTMLLVNFLKVQQLSHYFSKKRGYFDQKVRKNIAGDRIEDFLNKKLYFCGKNCGFHECLLGTKVTTLM